MKNYNFIFDAEGHAHSYDLKTNPFSRMRVTLRGAWGWAEELLKFNRTWNEVLFMAENGRKTYRLKRSELKNG